MQKRPYFSIPWDDRSDQPHVISDRRLKRRLRVQAWPEHLRVLATALVATPLLATCQLLGQQRLRPPASWPDFLGCGVSPHPALGELLDELGLRRLLIRCPLQAGRAQDAVLACIEQEPQRDWLLVVPQDRAAVCRPQDWARGLQRLLGLLPRQVGALQLGNAINRLKWGCASIAEYLDLVEGLDQGLRRLRPGLLIAGSAVIDFEPLLSLRSLINGYQHRFDAVSALLYVDRRGGPEALQYGIFDTRRKIATLAAMLTCAPRHAKRLWITEVNWPLQGQQGWAPTSPAECVSEEQAADYLQAYIRCAWDSGWVERLYPWQLIARGYGLIDDSNEQLRRRPAFYALQQLLRSNTP